VKGLKLRKTSSSEDKSKRAGDEVAKVEAKPIIPSSTITTSNDTKPQATSTASALGLGGYSSDEE
jgi:hypothetical protein